MELVPKWKHFSIPITKRNCPLSILHKLNHEMWDSLVFITFIAFYAQTLACPVTYTCTHLRRQTLNHALVHHHGGQILHDRQDKASLSPQSPRQADTKAKSINGRQFPGILRAKKIGYVTRVAVAKPVIGRGRMFLLNIGCMRPYSE